VKYIAFHTLQIFSLGERLPLRIGQRGKRLHVALAHARDDGQHGKKEGNHTETLGPAGLMCDC
jgi:hypothetical protein